MDACIQYKNELLQKVIPFLESYCDTLLSLLEVPIGPITNSDMILLENHYRIPFREWGVLKEPNNSRTVFCIKEGTEYTPVSSRYLSEKFGDYFNSPGSLKKDLLKLREAREYARDYEENAIVQIAHPSMVCKEYLLNKLTQEANTWAQKEVDLWAEETYR